MREAERNGNNGHIPGEEVRTEPVVFVKGDKSFQVTLRFEPDGDYIGGLCLELGIAAFGESPGEAESALIEAVVMQIEAQEDVGNLEDFLTRNGIALKVTKRAHWSPVNPQLMPA